MSGLGRKIRADSESEFWARREPDGSYIIGFTQAAQRALGIVAFVRGPVPGRRYASGESALTLESEKCVRQLPLPSGATVLELNRELEVDPSAVNRDPYGTGWVCRLQPDRPRELVAATARPPRGGR